MAFNNRITNFANLKKLLQIRLLREEIFWKLFFCVGYASWKALAIEFSIGQSLRLEFFAEKYFTEKLYAKNFPKKSFTNWKLFFTYFAHTLLTCFRKSVEIRRKNNLRNFRLIPIFFSTQNFPAIKNHTPSKNRLFTGICFITFPHLINI
jgi:hypothetical protein